MRKAVELTDIAQWRYTYCSGRMDKARRAVMEADINRRGEHKAMEAFQATLRRMYTARHALRLARVAQLAASRKYAAYCQGVLP